jgi:hypothetical protein
MKVNGHTLPELLQRLLEEGQWKTPADPSMVLEIIGSSSNLGMQMNDLEGMRRESEMNHLFRDIKLRDIYGLGSSKESGKPIQDSSILDIDNQVMIAGNYDEEAIALDYRLSPEKPRVVACTWDKSGNKSRWKVITPNFETFIALLGL